MANFQIKNMDEALYAGLKDLAVRENRSVSQQVQYMLKRHLARKGKIDAIRSPAQTLLDLSGSWADARTAEKIVEDLKTARTNSQKLPKGF
ncbi:MAG: hypothetical protein JEZ11_15775 [Desulfobacterales bacterium]|nr:hypothetical protein [Desulfobacterales bacterium]